jgi:fumarate reductase iron-sulfur subunit
MAQSIRLRVARYRPDKDTEPGWQEYDVPLREEWTVLDGLNHVKDEVDTTLSSAGRAGWASAAAVA